MAMGFCMGECVKLYGKCEECIMKRIGKYNKDGSPRRRSASSGDQMVVITHQPIGSRPRLVSENELATAAAAGSTESVPAPTKHPDYSRYRRAVAAASSRHRQESPDEDADVCSPMLATKSEPVQPSISNPASSASKRSSTTSYTPSDVPLKATSSQPRVRSTSSGDESPTEGGAQRDSVVGAEEAASSPGGGNFDYCQSLRFAMLYQPGNARLQVTIKSFCILPPNLTAGCYVVISLLTNCKSGEEKVVSTFKTTIKQKTKIPEWEETFVIDAVQRPDIPGETMIRLDVIAFDQFSREVCIGRLRVDVSVLKDCISQEFFRTLDEEKQSQLDPQFCDSSLLVGLFYHHTTQTLVLDMIKIKDLTTIASQLSGLSAQMSSASTASTPGSAGGPGGVGQQLKHMTYFVRARIFEGNALIKERRTGERKIQEEVLNESLTFNLDRRNIRNITAEFTLFVRSRKDERQLGWFSIGATSSGQTEKEHWSNMLRSHASPVVQWLHFKQPTSPMGSPMMTD